jgi:hypothetical protein
MDYRITDNKEEMDINAIHHYLSRSYWAKDVPKSVVTKAIENSLCFAVLVVDSKNKEKQVGFARLITALSEQKMFMQLWTPDAYSQTS